ncbi:hypothetical protein GF340_04090 [Candidatus Peregrinibacteria bacterium]|nr:hypothetical protein [Candidatus Peregrinibacteria bacterium]
MKKPQLNNLAYKEGAVDITGEVAKKARISIIRKMGSALLQGYHEKEKFKDHVIEYYQSIGYNVLDPLQYITMDEIKIGMGKIKDRIFSNDEILEMFRSYKHAKLKPGESCILLPTYLKKGEFVFYDDHSFSMNSVYVTPTTRDPFDTLALRTQKIDANGAIQGTSLLQIFPEELVKATRVYHQEEDPNQETNNEESIEGITEQMKIMMNDLNQRFNEHAKRKKFWARMEETRNFWKDLLSE